MINQEKLLSFINNDLKCSLFEIKQEYLIVIKSAVSAANLKRLQALAEELNYTVRFGGITFGGLVVSPN